MDSVQQVAADVTDCWICAQKCRIGKGKTGLCGKYTAVNGEIQELVPDSYLLTCPISVETMPVLHFAPEGKFLQITTTGCNFNCPGCVSTVFAKELHPDSQALRKLSAEKVIAKAREESCLGIVFVMNDPLASYFTFLRVARLAREHGLLVGCSSNGYFTDESLQKLMPYLDFINIGMKGFTTEAYRKCHGSKLEQVQKNLIALHDHGVHIEISTAYLNGNEEELKRLSEWLAGIDMDIPLQIMRYIPLEDADMKNEPGLIQSEKLCLELRKNLHYVFLFNTPGTKLLSTHCPNCDELVIKRDFFGPMGAKTRAISLHPQDATCPKCGTRLAIRELRARETFTESGFLGGYPFTRALEMIEAILLAIGVTRREDVAAMWEFIIGSGGMKELHHDIQTIPNYLRTIRKYGERCGKEKEATALSTYLQGVYDAISEKLATVTHKPRIYYVMGKPTFCLNAERFENHLAECAGGISVNKEIVTSGRPGMNIPVETLNKLNPDVIFLSSFLSSSLEDFYAECERSCVTVDAVKNRRVYKHPYPNIDFGSPRWVLGLMFLANTLHPDLFHFDIEAEAQKFYAEFYHVAFDPEALNLSFAKPSKNWTWAK